MNRSNGWTDEEGYVMSDESLLARIQKLEDREAIRALCSLYSLSVDNHDFATLGTLFAPTALYGWIDQPPQAIGATAIQSLLEERIAPAGPSFHVNHDMMVDWHTADPDRASGMVFCHAEVSPGGNQFVGAIRYHDKYVRHDGVWKFEARFLAFLYFAQPSDYVGIFTTKDRIRTAQPAKPAHWPAFG